MWLSVSRCRCFNPRAIPVLAKRTCQTRTATFSAVKIRAIARARFYTALSIRNARCERISYYVIAVCNCYRHVGYRVHRDIDHRGRYTTGGILQRVLLHVGIQHSRTEDSQPGGRERRGRKALRRGALTKSIAFRLNGRHKSGLNRILIARPRGRERRFAFTRFRLFPPLPFFACPKSSGRSLAPESLAATGSYNARWRA